MIVLGALLILGLFVWALTAAVSTIVSARMPPQQPLVVGEPGVPTGDPLTCEGACFDETDIVHTVLADPDLDAIGITEHDFPWGTYDPTTADAAFRHLSAYWAGNKGAPDSCVFALSDTPSVANLTSDKGSQDWIEYTGEHATHDITTTIQQSVRVFADTPSASTYMTTLYEQIVDCPILSVGPDNDDYTAEITLAPALELPPHVVAVGWVRTGDPGERWRAYTIDLQTGNLVVRTRLMTDGSFSEQDYRAFIEEYALRLSELEPQA